MPYTSYLLTQRSKLRRFDVDTRAQLASRFITLYRSLGWDRAACAKNLHITQRTLHNWESGKHDIPFTAYKLLRLLNRMELPGESWAGWCFHGGTLYSPEGRPFVGTDSSWWSLLIRRAAMFDQLYQQLHGGSAARAGTVSKAAPHTGTGRAAPGLVSVSTTCTTIQTKSNHSDCIMPPLWHQLSDSLPNSKTKPAPAASASASVLTPLYASPLTPICAPRLSWQQSPAPQLAPGWLGQVRQPHPPDQPPPSTSSAARNAASSKPATGTDSPQYRQIAGGGL